MDATIAVRAQLVDFELRENFQAPLGPDFGVDGNGAIVALVVNGGTGAQGRISMGVFSPVMSQMSIMSEFDTAMQPLVQSWVR